MSWIFGAYEVLLSRYSWISWIFRAYEAWISWIFEAFEALITCIFANIRDIQARAYKAQIICIFVNICGLWGANLRDIWGLWRTNHLYISKSQGYSGLESPVYLQISWIFANLINICKSHKYSGPKGAQISSIFSNILDILVSPGNLESPGYWGSMKCKSTGYS